MTTIIITSIVSILVYQLFTTLIYIISDENDEVLVTVSMGLWLYVATFICFIGRKILLLRARKYNLYAFYGQYSTNKLEYWLTNYYHKPLGF